MTHFLIRHHEMGEGEQTGLYLSEHQVVRGVFADRFSDQTGCPKAVFVLIEIVERT